jgi:DNA-binding NtrC family response regulator
VQSRLMRLVANNQYEPVGSRESKPADVRIIATSSQDLEHLTHIGGFRSDLYYYLKSLAIRLPPLRERLGDLPLLVDHLVKKFSQLSLDRNRFPIRVSPEAMQLLATYFWPGNLDQLQSVLRQALIENTGTVLASGALTQLLQHEPSAAPHTARHTTDWRLFLAERLKTGTSSLYGESVAEMERHLLLLVMESTEHNQAKSARLLGITRGNLRKKLRAMGLVPPATADEADGADESDDRSSP